MKKTRNQPKLIISIILLLLSWHYLDAQTIRVEKGIFDLRNTKPDDKFIEKMNGEWEFRFGSFIDPEANDNAGSATFSKYAEVPSHWTSYRSDGRRLPGFGYATYRCIVLLPQGFNQRLAFEMPIFETSYEMFINGVLVQSNGKPGKNRNEAKPEYRPTFFVYTPKTDTLNILLHVSNFHERKGGFWLPMKIGSFSLIQSRYANKIFRSIAISSILFASFLFFLMFSIFDRRNPKLLMFSLLALGLALRPFFSSSFLITNLNVHNWDLIVKGEYFTLLLMIAAGTRLIYFIYPSSLLRWFALFVEVLFSIVVLLLILLPAYIISYSAILVQVIAAIILIYSVTMSIRGILKKNWTDLVYLTALGTMAIGISTDTMVSMIFNSNDEYHILSFFMILFVFIQSALLLREWINSVHEKEKLSFQLEDANRNLELRVSERTRELLQKSDEMNAQSQRIALQNKKLSETISLKNKIFSVVSHDLRSPVVNILYTLNMLKEEEFRDKTETLANSCIQYSQMVINLLENMLVWGRGQEDMIKYAPAEYDLADIVLTNMSILKDNADRKSISMNFTQMGRSKGWFDRDLIDIIIRNLLSNAIKYSWHGGRISIHVKERTEEKGGLVIKICDNGVGISEERLSKLFRGTDIDTTPGTDDEKGTGLGLKLVHELVTISKGTISVESSADSGTCFTVNIPGKNSKH